MWLKHIMEDKFSGGTVVNYVDPSTHFRFNVNFDINGAFREISIWGIHEFRNHNAVFGLKDVFYEKNYHQVETIAGLDNPARRELIAKLLRTQNVV